jgi:RimJ/RimL family protein N-acetyltransferase
MLRALLSRVFGPLKAHRIGFDVTADNARALALYPKLGFQREGLVRECWRRPAGDWVDCALLGLLAREYQP